MLVDKQSLWCNRTDAFTDVSSITTTQESIMKETFNEKKKKTAKKGL